MGWLSKLFGGGDKPPPPPDYKAEAERAQQSSQYAQTLSDWSNRPDQVDMYGNKTSWDTQAAIDPATGQKVSKWTSKVTLSPEQQASVDSEMRISQGLMGTAEGMLGRVNDAVAKPFDWSNLQAMGQVPGAGTGLMTGLNTGSLGAMPGADDAARQRIESGLLERLRPEQERSMKGLEGKLSNMGFRRGTEQWDREMDRLQESQDRARFGAIEQGGQEMQRMYDMGMGQREQGWQELQGAGEFQNTAQQQQFNQQMQSAGYQNQLRQQQIAEQQLARSMPLNELSAFTSGQQVGAPQFADFSKSQSVGGVDYSGAAKDQYSGSMDQYNAAQKQKQGMMSGITSIASTALMAY